MPEDCQYDAFLSHSSKGKAVVRPLAERLPVAVRKHPKVWFDEWVLKPDDSIPAKIKEGLEHSRVLVLCMSASQGFLGAIPLCQSKPVLVQCCRWN
jgi:hypothetical protein